MPAPGPSPESGQSGGHPGSRPLSRIPHLARIRVSRGGSDQLAGEVGVRDMARVIDDRQIGPRPYAVELPRVADGGLKVKAAIDQDPRNAGERAGSTK